MSTAVEADLMKIQIEVSLLGEPKRKLWALIDNGSSHCFFAPRVLSPSQLSLLETMSSEAITVTSATEVKDSKAFISEAIVSISDSNFLQSFIITDAVQKHDAVLGMNFLKKYKVKQIMVKVQFVLVHRQSTQHQLLQTLKKTSKV